MSALLNPTCTASDNKAVLDTPLEAAMQGQPVTVSAAEAGPAPTVLTPSIVIRLGLQNDVARRLRMGGCRVLKCSSLNDRRLSIQIVPPPTWHRLNLTATRVRHGSEPERHEASMDGVRVWWLDNDATPAPVTTLCLEVDHVA